MSSGFIIWIGTMSLSIIISSIILIISDANHRGSLKGHSLDEFILWPEILQSEIDFTDRVEEYREAFITIAMIILAYVKRMQPQQIRVKTI